MKYHDVIISLLFTLLIVCVRSAPVFAMDVSEVRGNFSIGIGWERIYYEENEPDNGLSSDVDAHNMVVALAGEARLKKAFARVETILPVIKYSDKEQWEIGAVSFQTNRFEYGWYRVDGSIGFSISPMLMPYGGLRWSKSIQKRKEIVRNKQPVDMDATETVRSWNVLLGLRGEWNIAARSAWYYNLKYAIPLTNEVTNTSMPGFTPSDNGGYAMEIITGLNLSYPRGIALDCRVFGGHIHWTGSPWCRSGTTYRKWPENDTYYLGVMFNLLWDI